ncbi:GIY-YIG nuclease family protein [Vagococcus martis]|uniref:hypothetical protein n=1 Tax=Vagococcus martis TaxID=1768210 RepID=UPI001301D3F3|nr:hypothetical protein [Vagococcus martis]
MYRYYVYGHYTDDGTLFYIGKGSGGRLNNNNRNSAMIELRIKEVVYQKYLLMGC